jgi:hypothetical protein
VNEVTLFAIGFVLFIATTWATLVFGYRLFNDLYRADRLRGVAEAEATERIS